MAEGARQEGIVRVHTLGIDAHAGALARRPPAAAGAHQHSDQPRAMKAMPSRRADARSVLLCDAGS